ncbi:TATA-binding protein-associated factor 2N-like [Aphis craccivora]|uniref:TATA-binding protein-associated factor 2N-like n=1 Tax=Aphis craccivora TaxID=307492 RepID=A0A6G0ZK55_APHCR|nr:TATA-binding protein-associated factor 2N-like [Aphis craccivora]
MGLSAVSENQTAAIIAAMNATTAAAGYAKAIVSATQTYASGPPPVPGLHVASKDGSAIHRSLWNYIIPTDVTTNKSHKGDRGDDRDGSPDKDRGGGDRGRGPGSHRGRRDLGGRPDNDRGRSGLGGGPDDDHGGDRGGNSDDDHGGGYRGGKSDDDHERGDRGGAGPNNDRGNDQGNDANDNR